MGSLFNKFVILVIFATSVVFAQLPGNGPKGPGPRIKNRPDQVIKQKDKNNFARKSWE